MLEALREQVEPEDWVLLLQRELQEAEALQEGRLGHLGQTWPGMPFDCEFGQWCPKEVDPW